MKSVKSDPFAATEAFAPATQRGDFDSARAPNQCDQLSLWIVHSPDSDSLLQKIALSEAATCVVGRGIRASVTVHDSRMSKEHFAITLSRKGVECTDLNSTNGTFVDGVPCNTSLLRPGSVLRAGDSLFVFARGSWHDVESQARQLATLPMPLLLEGPTGTGKEVLARFVHQHSGRPGAFVAVNCAALTKELAFAEFFGHTKGAFSGATGARVGLFRAADGGTLFLDEIGDFPSELQAILLRILEDQRVRPVGADADIVVDVRIIAATNVELNVAVRESRFRSDLYARIAQLYINLPPLNDRREDILGLVREFAQGATVTCNAAEALLLWDWPMNVRQLRSVVKATAALAKDPRLLHLEDFGAQLPQLAMRLRERRASKSFGQSETRVSDNSLATRRAELSQLLRQHDGNIAQVARTLGKPRAQIYRWVRAFGISRTDFRGSS